MREGQVSGPVSKMASGDSARKPIGVFLLEDQEIVRRGVRVLLEADPDIQGVLELARRIPRCVILPPRGRSAHSRTARHWH
jgi:hypothetical protein